MKKAIIIGICMLVLIVGCDSSFKEKCEEAVKEDYGYSNPKCNIWVMTDGDGCQCANKICKSKSCIIEDFIEFKLI